MATAVAPKSTATDDLLLALGAEGEVRLQSIQDRFPESVIAIAWAKGEIEFGKTKYVITGNPETAVVTHNGVTVPPPAVVIEGGVEWTGPKQRWHQPYHKIREKKLPACKTYQKYQLEICVSKERDVWEWLEEGQPVGRKETRYARREIDRAEAERLFDFFVRLTDKGQAALTGN